MSFRRINWPGLFCGLSLMSLLLLSIAYKVPWWQLNIADGLGHVSVSPLDVDINLMGASIDVPLIWYLNVGSKLALLLVAAAFLFYSVNMDTQHSRRLLDVIYKKPVYMVASLVIIGIVNRFIVGAFLPFSLPIVGTSTVALSSNSVTLSIPVTASFTWVFWLALAGALLSILTRLYHNRFNEFSSAQIDLK